LTQKIDLRKYYRTLRKQISSERREAAAKLLLIYLLNKNFSHILSFASCGTELDLVLVNQYYASQGCLLLPKIDGYQLEIYQVQDIGFDLVSSSAGHHRSQMMQLV
jgi:5-formyltetrahydrofolate cyclo-ligase